MAPNPDNFLEAREIAHLYFICLSHSVRALMAHSKLQLKLFEMRDGERESDGMRGAVMDVVCYSTRAGLTAI